MVKRTIPVATRLALIITLAALLLLAAGYTAGRFLQPGQTQVQIPIYNGSHKAQVDYRVILEPNAFFADESAGPGQAYLVPLTQSVESTLNYRFEGEAPAELSGEYRVTAVLTGYVMKEVSGGQAMGQKQRIKVWEKSSDLLPPTPFNTRDKAFAIQQTVPIMLKDYVNFVDGLKQALRVSVDQVELVVYYRINVSAQTPGGVVESQLTPFLVIPVKDSTFMVGGSLSDQKACTINEDNSVPVPGLKQARAIGAAFSLLLLLALLGVLKMTRAEQASPSRKELLAIVKKHGNRMAELQGVLPNLERHLLEVTSFEDLVKVADESGQPILYENVHTGWHRFFVVGDSFTYGYSVQVDESREEIPPVDA